MGADAVTALLPASVEVFGVTLIGVNERTGVKILLTLGLVAVVYGARRLALHLARRLPGRRDESRRFWSRQGVRLAAAIVLLLGLVSIWVTPGADLTTGVGLVSAGLAFALSQVITAVAGYFVILRGDIFTVGDRITLAGVRGDVVSLGFIKTTILEMGQPPAVKDADPAVWVHSRQPTGRLITVSNGLIFSEPVYNYSRDFPYLWEEIVIPVAYDADREVAERLLLEAAREQSVRPTAIDTGLMRRMQEIYRVRAESAEPAVYWRITEDWLEMTVRFLVPDHGVREIKDRVSRGILARFDAAGIAIATATQAIVSAAPLEVRPADDR